MARTHWSDSDNPDRWAWGMGRIWLVILAICAVIGIGGYAFKLAVSDAKGKGDAAMITNDGQNRLQAEREFSQRYNAIKAADKKITGFAQDLRDAEARKVDDLDFYRENLNGTRNACRDSIAQYNALVLDPQRARYRPAQFPDAVDETDESTDCEPAKAPTPAPSN